MEMGDLQPFATTLVLRTSRKLNFRQVLSVRLEPIEGLCGFAAFDPRLDRICSAAECPNSYDFVPL